VCGCACQWRTGTNSVCVFFLMYLYELCVRATVRVSRELVTQIFGMVCGQAVAVLRASTKIEWVMCVGVNFVVLALC